MKCGGKEKTHNVVALECTSKPRSKGKGAKKGYGQRIGSNRQMGVGVCGGAPLNWHILGYRKLIGHMPQTW